MGTIMPSLPPMITRSGGARSSNASGAALHMTSTRAPKRSALAATRWHAAGFLSMEMTWAAGSSSEHSMPYEPVPAPTSQMTPRPAGRALPRSTHLTSAFDSGTPSARSHISSGMPGAAGDDPCTARPAPGGAMISRTEPPAKLCSAISARVPSVICSSSRPNEDPTAARDPAREGKRAAICSGRLISSQNISVVPSMSPSRSRPCALTSFQSCQGRPSRAASNCTDEMPGMILASGKSFRIAGMMLKQPGSPLVSTHTSPWPALALMKLRTASRSAVI